MHAGNDAAPKRHRIQGEMTIYRAAELRAGLLELIATEPNVALDLAEVGEIDTAGVQLLIAARREAELRQGRLVIVATSEAVREAFNLLRLDENLNIH